MWLATLLITFFARLVSFAKTLRNQEFCNNLMGFIAQGIREFCKNYNVINIKYASSNTLYHLYCFFDHQTLEKERKHRIKSYRACTLVLLRRNWEEVIKSRPCGKKKIIRSFVHHCPFYHNFY